MYLPESAGWLAALGVPAVLWMVMDRLEPDPAQDTGSNPADNPPSPAPPVPPPPPRPRPMPIPPAEDTVDYPPGDGGHREPAGPPSKGSGPGSIPDPTPRRYGMGVISGFSTWVSALIWGDPDAGGGLFGRRKPR